MVSGLDAWFCPPVVTKTTVWATQAVPNARRLTWWPNGWNPTPICHEPSVETMKNWIAPTSKDFDHCEVYQFGWYMFIMISFHKKNGTHIETAFWSLDDLIIGIGWIGTLTSKQKHCCCIVYVWRMKTIWTQLSTPDILSICDVATPIYW